MTTTRRIGWLLLLLAALAWGCGERAAPPAPTPVSEADTTPAPVAAAPPPAAACAPVEALAAMDTRRPVPLQPMMAWHQKQNMMGHLVAVQRIADALGREDWDAIAEAAKLIGTSPAMQTMCEHMGAGGAAGFTEQALEFHRRADGIAEAALTHDAAAVLRSTARTLEACTGCHATFRQEVVDAATWQARTGSAHDPGR